MLGRTPAPSTSPAAEGRVIAHFDAARRLLRHLVARSRAAARGAAAHGHRRAVLHHPGEKRAVREAPCRRARTPSTWSRSRCGRESAPAADPRARRARRGRHRRGTTEVAVSRSPASSTASRSDGGRRDERGDRSVHPEAHNVRSASAAPRRSSWRSGRAALGGEQSIVVKGSDASLACPGDQDREDEVREAVHDCIGSIVATIRSSLECTPPESPPTWATAASSSRRRRAAGRLDDHPQGDVPARDDRGQPLSCVVRASRPARRHQPAGARQPPDRTWGPRNGPIPPNVRSARMNPALLYIPNARRAPAKPWRASTSNARGAPAKPWHPRYSDRLLARAGRRPSDLTRPRQRSFMAPTGGSDALGSRALDHDFHTAASGCGCSRPPGACRAPPSRRSAGGSRSTSIPSDRLCLEPRGHRDCSSRS